MSIQFPWNFLVLVSRAFCIRGYQEDGKVQMLSGAIRYVICRLEIGSVYFKPGLRVYGLKVAEKLGTP